jgi:hypothetical protein
VRFSVKLYDVIVKILLRKLSYMVWFWFFVKKICQWFCDLKKAVTLFFSTLLVITSPDKSGRSNLSLSVVARLKKSAEAIPLRTMRLPRPDRSGLAMIKSCGILEFPVVRYNAVSDYRFSYSYIPPLAEGKA